MDHVHYRSREAPDETRGRTRLRRTASDVNTYAKHRHAVHDLGRGQRGIDGGRQHGTSRAASKRRGRLALQVGGAISG
jgi:hypothetical protein